MSSSNQAKICIIEESGSYGVTPGSGNFSTFRYKSESLSGSPQLTESQTIRTDRMSSGQVVVGLDVGGQIGCELAKDALTDMLIRGAMKSTLQTATAVTVALAYDASAKTLTRGSGSWPTTIVGKIITLAGYTSGAAVNNDDFLVSERTSSTVIKVVPKSGITFVTDAGAGASYEIADYLEIGTSTVSFSIEKIFNDLTTKAINYKGMVVNEMSLDVAYGKICELNFNFMGNAQNIADAANEMITDSRTVDVPATSAQFNGSIDMPIFALETSSFAASNIVVESVKLSLNNNNQPQNGIGQAAPRGYDAGKASISVEIVAYLDNNSWALLDKRTNQTAFKVAFALENSGGIYAFYMPAVQASFDDPQSPGTDQQIKLSLKGVAKVGASSESALTVSIL